MMFLLHFQKASFVSDDAAPNANIDLFDPDFWNKMMPENAHKEKTKLSDLIQEGPRKTRKQIATQKIEEIEDDFDDPADQTIQSDNEEEHIEEVKIKGWTYSERSRLKKAYIGIWIWTMEYN